MLIGFEKANEHEPVQLHLKSLKKSRTEMLIYAPIA